MTLRTLKRFDEPYTNEVSRRIAVLEPEQYTRAGAAIRHASTTLLREAAAHRLLLLLSDGKPNDVDHYEGHGVEDTRRQVPVWLQGVFPFCLTVDRNAATYLAAVFGVHQYALLTKPELLPIVLLEWMKRLLLKRNQWFDGKGQEIHRHPREFVSLHQGFWQGEDRAGKLRANLVVILVGRQRRGLDDAIDTQIAQRVRHAEALAQVRAADDADEQRQPLRPGDPSRQPRLGRWRFSGCRRRCHQHETGILM